MNRSAIPELLEAVKALLSTAKLCPHGDGSDPPHVRISHPARISELQAAYDAVAEGDGA